jgi:hypothetical protein
MTLKSTGYQPVGPLGPVTYIHGVRWARQETRTLGVWSITPCQGFVLAASVIWSHTKGNE